MTKIDKIASKIVFIIILTFIYILLVNLLSFILDVSNIKTLIIFTVGYWLCFFAIYVEEKLEKKKYADSK